MAAGEAEAVARSQFAEDMEALALVGDFLAMHQRHGEELALGVCVQRIEMAAGEGIMGNFPSQAIMGKGTRRAAMQIAWQLVEEQDTGERSLRITEEAFCRLPGKWL